MPFSLFPMHSLLTICLSMSIRTAEAANASFSNLPVNVLRTISSYPSQVESAKVFRFINRKCDAGYREHAITKFDDFKTLLDQFHNESLDDAQVTAHKIIASFHDLKLSGLFAFEGPRVLKEWMSAMQSKHKAIWDSSDGEDREHQMLYSSTMDALVPVFENWNPVQAQTERKEEVFVDHLIANSHQTFWDLMMTQFDHLEPRLVAKLLLNEYLWETIRCFMDLPLFDDLFGSMDGVDRGHDVLKHLVEIKGLILIHPSHYKSIWTLDFVNDDSLHQDIFKIARMSIQEGMSDVVYVALSDAEINEFIEDLAIFWRMEIIENGGKYYSKQLMRSISSCQGLQRGRGHGQRAMPSIRIRNAKASLDDAGGVDDILNTLIREGSGRFVPMAFDILVQRNVSVLSEALRRFVDNVAGGLFKKAILGIVVYPDDAIIQFQQNQFGRFFDTLGAAIDVITIGRSDRKTLYTEWSAMLAQIALNWINQNRGVSMKLILSESRLLESYYDGVKRMNNETLSKIQGAFPWMIPDNLIETLLTTKSA